LFKEYKKTNKGLFMTLITPYGAEENANFFRIVDHQITLEPLFVE